MTGLKMANKLSLQKKEEELEEKLQSYLGLKHDLLKDNGFKFNIKKTAYENKKLNLDFVLDDVKT